jgi:stress-induced morphogen
VSATPDELKQRIEAGIPGSQADVSGDGHHFNAVISAPAFRGLSRIAQHRLVYDVFGSELGDRIHALSIQTRIPETPKPEDNHRTEEVQHS